MTKENLTIVKAGFGGEDVVRGLASWLVIGDGSEGCCEGLAVPSSLISSASASPYILFLPPPDPWPASTIQY